MLFVIYGSSRLNAIEQAKAEAIAKIEAEFAKPEPVPAPQEPARPFRGNGLKPSTEKLELEEPSFT
jgi:hypothetical protein